MLYPLSIIGTLVNVCVVSLPTGVTEAPVVATVNSHGTEESLEMQEQIEAVDLSILATEEWSQVRALLHRLSSVFSSYEGDLGCTNLISHEIPLLDDIPVQQCHWRIPPMEYEVV